MIRKARIEDIDVLNKLFQKLLEYERENYDDNIKEDLNINSYFNNKINKEDDIILVAEENNEIIGYIYSNVDSDNKIKKELEANISSLYIIDEYRNKKIGTMLIDKTINLLKEKNVKYVYIENLKDNECAKYLYQKLGFKVFRENRRKELL